MPARNRGKIINESVQSIIDQTENNWELIIIDDHSDPGDKTKEVVNSFHDSRIKYFRLDDKYGRGIAAARNFGIIQASSDLIAITDSDDINYPERLELSIKQLSAGADLVFARIDLWDPETGEIKLREDKLKAGPFDFERFKTDNFIPNPTVAVKKQWLLDFPYNSFFQVGEDYDFFSRIIEYGAKFEFIDKSLAKYRVHEKSIMKSGDFEINFGQIVKHNRKWS